jgi:hypothetical protein
VREQEGVRRLHEGRLGLQVSPRGAAGAGGSSR